MSDVVERVAAVVLEHSYAEHTARCGCGLEVGYGDKYDQGYEKHAAHVAAAVVEALGLTEEVGVHSADSGEMWEWSEQGSSE